MIEVKVKCPVCENKEEFFLEFFTIEIQQGGKNIYCPYCHWLLWVPINGNPHPVPLNPHHRRTTQKNFRQLVTEIYLGN